MSDWSHRDGPRPGARPETTSPRGAWLVRTVFAAAVPTKDDRGPDGIPPRRLPSRVHKSATGTTCDRPNCQRSFDTTGRSDPPRWGNHAGRLRRLPLLFSSAARVIITENPPRSTAHPKILQDSRGPWGATGGAGSRGTRWSRVAWNVDRPRQRTSPASNGRPGPVRAIRRDEGSREPGRELGSSPPREIDPGWRRGG